MKNNIQVVIYPNAYTQWAIMTDTGLVNLHAEYDKSGFFKKVKLRHIIDEFVRLKKALISNHQASLIISADLADKVHKWCCGEVLNVNDLPISNQDDGLFDLDFKKDDDPDAY